MKYVRGYLVAGIFAALSWLVMQLGQRLSSLIDMVYPYVTRSLQQILSQWSSSVDFLVWQVLAAVLVVIALATVVLMVILRWNPVQWLGWVLSAVSIVFFLHTCIYGLNTYAGPISDDVRLEMTEYTLTELVDATTYYRDQANAFSQKIQRDENGDPQYPSFRQLAVQAGDGFDVLTYEESLSVFAGNTLPVKELGWADMYTSMGITGFTFPLTGEAAVNPQIPAISLPFTMCHEMAHRISIATERDANFAAFLACRYNPSDDFRYSAYFMAYSYCYNALAKVSDDEAKTAAAQIRAGETQELHYDRVSYSQFFASRKNDTATKVADTVNDTYIKTSGDEKGVLSYGEVCDYLVSWHIQQVVSPTQEEEVKFDPFDKTQVDLSGLPYSPTVIDVTEPSEDSE